MATTTKTTRIKPDGNPKWARVGMSIANTMQPPSYGLGAAGDRRGGLAIAMAVATVLIALVVWALIYGGSR